MAEKNLTPSMKMAMIATAIQIQTLVLLTIQTLAGMFPLNK